MGLNEPTSTGQTSPDFWLPSTSISHLGNIYHPKTTVMFPQFPTLQDALKARHQLGPPEMVEFPKFFFKPWMKGATLDKNDHKSDMRSFPGERCSKFFCGFLTIIQFLRQSLRFAYVSQVFSLRHLFFHCLTYGALTAKELLQVLRYSLGRKDLWGRCGRS